MFEEFLSPVLLLLFERIISYCHKNIYIIFHEAQTLFMTNFFFVNNGSIRRDDGWYLVKMKREGYHKYLNFPHFKNC